MQVFSGEVYEEENENRQSIFNIFRLVVAVSDPGARQRRRISLISFRQKTFGPWAASTHGLFFGVSKGPWKFSAALSFEKII